MKNLLTRIIDRFSFAEWIIRFEQGSPPKIKGSAPRIFAQETAQLLEKSGIHRARISGEKAGAIVSLSFSSNIPKPLHQRLRNLWTHYQGR